MDPTRVGPPRPEPRRRGRRRLALTATLALSMIGAGTVVPAIAAVPAAPDGGLIAEYRFDQTTGASVANTAAGSAFGAAVVQNAADTQWADGALTLTGGAKGSAGNWVRLPQNLLVGEEAATITTEVKIDASMKNSFNFLWNIGNDSNQSYFFTSVRDSARSAITTASGGGEVNARSTMNLDADRWYSLTTVLDGAKDTLSFYIDGALAATTQTALTPASIADQSLNAIGRSPWPDPLFKGAVSNFRVYDRALSASEVADVSDADAQQHASAVAGYAARTLEQLEDPIAISDSVTTLPDAGGAVTWSTTDTSAAIGADGRTLTLAQPAAGEPSRDVALTATAEVRGVKATRQITARVQPAAAADDPYGYLMVHFIEDAQGYAEKIYLDVSRGNNAEQWDPLNGGKPILASALGTTGVRDPYITRNPQTGTYYIIATDLRVFGGDRGSNGCTEWCYWSSQGSTKLVVWESDDLVTWSAPRQLDVAPPAPRLGMAWAPEATWVPDFDGQGNGSFVVYWASKLYDQGATQPGYSRILWGSTSDFTQASYAYGGVFVDDGGETIDTTLIQHDGKTYRVTKDNAQGKGIYMDATSSPTWWKTGTAWTRVQERIGASWAGGNAGGVEGPAGFKRNDADQWYLYVDVIPTVGYKPMTTNDLDAGFSVLQSADYYMPPHTKHGGILDLTRADYDRVRAADAVAAVKTDLGSTEVRTGADVEKALPETAEVTTAYGRGVSSLPVDWDTTGVDTSQAGSYVVTGTVRSLGANDNDWVGRDGSTAWNAADRTPRSVTAIRVTATVVVTSPTPTSSPTASPTATPTVSPTATPTATPTAEPTVTPTAEPTATPTAEPTVTPTAEPTVTPTAEPTVTPTAQPTATAGPTSSSAPTTGPVARPQATLSASSVERGGAVRVTVSGLEPGEQVSAELRSEPVRITGIPAADAAGRVTFDVRVPSDFAVGAHTVVVTGADATVIARLPLTVVAKGTLAATGAQPALGGALLAAFLLVGGAIAWSLRRRVS
ncbi:LamG-like jellyroll fold domain-containing protein [uncultured Microbacterium sp.]|uniref:LamG-like jellyroll fold domain-containing protein n=1 Tax=uncultured Microbacterium sp. TaxID=191216 RepID=UPI0025CC26E7|nr:LamG-like jellyroll fold domain-containing protein [uncultured Microbacterium sp.]